MNHYIITRAHAEQDWEDGDDPIIVVMPWDPEIADRINELRQLADRHNLVGAQSHAPLYWLNRAQVDEWEPEVLENLSEEPSLLITDREAPTHDVRIELSRIDVDRSAVQPLGYLKHTTIAVYGRAIYHSMLSNMPVKIARSQHA